MGKLEEFTATSQDFAKAREGVEALARVTRLAWQRTGFQAVKNGCFRILTDPESELESWERKGGYKAQESTWGRFVCTANPYLPWMMAQDLLPPGLKKTEVMIEVEKPWDIDCVKYSKAALGVYPIRKANCQPAWDIYVSNEDLVLAECYSDSDVQITDIKKMWIDPNSEVRRKAERFARKHKIPIEYEFPDPSVDKDQEEWYRDNYPAKEAEQKIDQWREVLKEQREIPMRNLVQFLKSRRDVCYDPARPPRDVVAGALAEAYDREMHKETPFGASDAIATMIEVGQREPMLSPVFGLGQPREGCLKPEIGAKTVV